MKSDNMSKDEIMGFIILMKKSQWEWINKFDWKALAKIRVLAKMRIIA